MYRVTSSTNFVEYIKKKKKSYLDGKYFDPEELMQLALNNYTIRMESGKWRVGGGRGGASIEQEQLIALSAELLKFKSEPRFSNGTGKKE